MSCKEDYTENDAAESSAPSTKRPRTPLAWDYFEKFVDDDGLPKAKCKNCGKAYMSREGGGTSNMRCHVTRCCAQGQVYSHPPINQEKFREKISEEMFYPYQLQQLHQNQHLVLVDVYSTSIGILSCLKMLRHYYVQMIGFVELHLHWILMMKNLLRTL